VCTHCNSLSELSRTLHQAMSRDCSEPAVCDHKLPITSSPAHRVLRLSIISLFAFAGSQNLEQSS